MAVFVTVRRSSGRLFSTVTNCPPLSPTFPFCHKLPLKTTNFSPLSTTFTIFKNLNHFCYHDFSKFSKPYPDSVTPTFRFFKISPQLGYPDFLIFKKFTPTRYPDSKKLGVKKVEREKKTQGGQKMRKINRKSEKKRRKCSIVS